MAYTNSKLVAVRVFSPNHSGQRTRKIDTITIHCVVGQLSAETIGNCFTAPSVKASCNYGVGTDGRIVLCVEEKNRSWCTSNAANDQRAITIEVACDRTHPYAVNSKAYDSLIKLVADICKRNGIKKMLWKADKSLVGSVSKQNMTVHRWFANKACPGDFLYNRHGDIANKVNALLGTAGTSAPTGAGKTYKINSDMTYTVKTGDTLSAIVAGLRTQGSKVSLEMIRRWNSNIKDINKIVVGQKLKLYYGKIRVIEKAAIRTGQYATKKKVGTAQVGEEFYQYGSKTNTKGNKWFKIWVKENGVETMRYIYAKKCKKI